MARSAVPDVIREKIHELQSKLEQIETQQRETRAAALGFISEALERLGLTLQDLAAGMGGRRGRKPKAAKRAGGRPKKAAAKKPGKRGRPKKSAGAKAAAAPKKGRRKKPGRLVGSKVPAKYRGPNGESWSGRGKQPRWLAALVAEGRTPAEFLI